MKASVRILSCRWSSHDRRPGQPCRLVGRWSLVGGDLAAGHQAFRTTGAVSPVQGRAGPLGRSANGTGRPTLMPSVADSQCRHFSQTRSRRRHVTHSWRQNHERQIRRAVRQSFTIERRRALGDRCRPRTRKRPAVCGRHAPEHQPLSGPESLASNLARAFRGEEASQSQGARRSFRYVPDLRSWGAV